MFHIGVATQHPPLPEPGQISDLGINFIKQCLTIDPVRRPSATELMNHPWMLEFRETLLQYEAAELAVENTTTSLNDTEYEGASVARQAAIIQEHEIQQIKSSPPTSPESASLESE